MSTFTSQIQLSFRSHTVTMFLSDSYAKKVFKNSPEFRHWLPVEVLAEDDDLEVSKKNPGLNNNTSDDYINNAGDLTDIKFTGKGVNKADHQRISQAKSKSCMTDKFSIPGTGAKSRNAPESSRFLNKGRASNSIHGSNVPDFSLNFFNMGRASSRNHGLNVPDISLNPEAQFPILCSFCYQRGDRRSFYTNHQLKDEFGNIKCPILRSLAGEECGAKGNRAQAKISFPRLGVTKLPMVQLQNFIGPNIIRPRIFQENIRFPGPQFIRNRYT